MGGDRQTLDDRPFSVAAWQAEGVFFVAIGKDVVVLDCRTDAYACLPDAATALTIRGDVIHASPDWIEGLQSAGLISATEAPSRLALPSAPLEELTTTRQRARLGEEIAFVRALFQARRLGPDAPVRALIAALPPEPSSPRNIDRISALTERFQRRLPWIPGQGACLYRAFVLRSLLRHCQEDATWVFGVRTWPFAAHCWLQVGDAVLDDSPKRVALYTPIMAV